VRIDPSAAKAGQKRGWRVDGDHFEFAANAVELLREVRRTKPGSEAGGGSVGARDDEVGHADTAEQLDPLRQRPQAAAMLAVP
jgi:hypothetical protein